MTQLHAKRPPFCQLPQAWLGNLDSAEITVGFALASFANGNGQCWPSLKSLASRTGLSRNTVKRALDGLEAKKVLSVEQRTRTDGGFTSHNYVIDLTGENFLSAEPNNPANTSRSASDPPSSKFDHGGGSNFDLGHGQILTKAGSNFEGAYIELDPLDRDPSDQDPHTPLTPHGAESVRESLARENSQDPQQAPKAQPEVRTDSPTVVPLQAKRFDKTAAQYEPLYPWQESSRRFNQGFVDYVIRSLPKKDDQVEARECAKAFLRKARTLEGRLEAVEELWDDYQQHLEKQREVEAAKARAAEIDKYRGRWRF